MYGGDRKPSPGDALHQEALEYLKTTLKLKELEARAYKSIAYRHVKETSPESKHFERAEKMLELVKNKNFIKEYKDKLADTMKILEDIDSEKEKRNSETASQVSEKSESRRSRRSKKQSGGDNFSETSVDQHFTESNANKPYFNEYRQMKAKYMQAKLKQNGGSLIGGNATTFSETSVMNNYTESNAAQPFYKEYMDAKNQYLEAKLKQSGGVFTFNTIQSLQQFINEHPNSNISATIKLI
jgi:hypothetical protein